MFKKLLFALSLLCAPLFAQQTKVVPDCIIPFSFTATGSTSNLTCGNNTLGIVNWVLVYSNTGYSVISLVVQSAPDNHGIPGSWGTFGGTVLSSTQYVGSSGVNPNTSITSANTGFAGYFAWMRVMLASVTGTGKVTGALYGYLNSTLAKAGNGGGAGSVTTCPGTIAGQVTVYQSPTVLCGIVQSAFDAAAANALVRFGPPESSLPFFLSGFVTPAQMLVTGTHTTGGHTGIGVENNGFAGIWAVNMTNTETSIGLESDAYSGTPSGLAYSAYHFVGSLDSSSPSGLYGAVVFPQIGNNSTVTNLWGFYRYRPAFNTASVLTNDFSFFSEATGGQAANAYPLWFDEPGVYAVHSINSFDSVFQARPTLYNPLFTKFTVGTSNFERCIPGCQWQTNVANYGTEAGGTGTLRDNQMIGNRWLYKTAAPGTNTTELASTAFVATALPVFPTSAKVIGTNGSAQPIAVTVQGNSSTVQMASTNPVTTNDCARYDANKNLEDAGAPCGSGGGGTGGGTSGWSGLPLTFVANATQFSAPVGGALTSTTEATVQLKSSATATITNLQVTLSAALGVSATLAVTLRDAGVSQALTCTTASGGTTCTDTTHSVNVAVGDLLSFQLVSGGSVTAGLPQIEISYAIGTSGVGTTSVSGTAPITVSSPTTTPVIACATCLTGTPTNHGVAIGAATQATTYTAVCTTGQFLGGNTGADPSCQTPPSGGTANQNIRSLGAGFNGGGTALTTGLTVYVFVPFACTITGYNITADTGTVSLDVWKIASGTAIPTVTNSILTGGFLALASGTALHVVGTSLFTTTTVTAFDILAVEVEAVTSATNVSLVIPCNAS